MTRLSRLSRSVAFVFMISGMGAGAAPADGAESDPKTSPSTIALPIAEQVAQHEQDFFGMEREAREVENRGIVPIWDRLNAAAPGDRLDLIRALPVTSFSPGRPDGITQPGFGITIQKRTESDTTLDAAAWRKKLDQFRASGYEMIHSDWHHAQYRRTEAGEPLSDVRFTVLATRRQGVDRLEIKGTLRVTWTQRDTAFLPRTVTVVSAEWRERSGPPAFREMVQVEGVTDAPLANTRGDMGAIVVYDLNHDQRPDILLGNANHILWNRGPWQFEPGPLIIGGNSTLRANTALVGDFDGDQRLDWICDDPDGQLKLYSGTPEGGFAGPPRSIDLGPYPLRMASCLTAGDVDGDGDLDVFCGQWRLIYEKMPDRYWDALDGYGNTLLINDGTGTFHDGTVAAGLHHKRHRRTYSASLMDIDGDRHLDLLVVSDFRGIDLYLNDGTGRFQDQTEAWVENPHLFGMSHTVADFNGDGHLDVYALGMGSTTARRLDQMEARPAGFNQWNDMRSVMGYGNRMYMANPSGPGYQVSPFADQLARTGWSWGSSSLDFDNDGDMDIYVGNGHITGESTRDYCSNFWSSDVYVMPKYEGADIASYLDSQPGMETLSWDGFQVNSLLVNRGEDGFVNLGFMLDVGFDFDTRRIISADFDLDGRMDVLLTRKGATSGFFHQRDAAQTLPALLVMQNVLAEAAVRPWIGCTLEAPAGTSVLGARIEVETSLGTRRAVVLSGDSYLCQHPAQKHFGLRPDEQVTSLSVAWPNGVITRIEDPALRRYHHLR